MMASGGTLPPVRVSDAERERALRALRDASVAGRLSSDSFLRRVDAALHSRTRDEFADLVRDVPGRGRADVVLRSVSAISLFTARTRSSWRTARLGRLPLPAATDRAYVLGRSRDSDLVLAHPNVSWRHARLAVGPAGWTVADLGSTNGTRVNGWALREPQALRPGDRVSFGLLSLVVSGSRRSRVG